MPGTVNAVFDELRSSGRLCDITLIVGKKEIPAHKVILSGCSPYFLAMFTSSLSESREKTVTLPVFDEDAVEAIVHFAYKNEIDITSDNVQVLLATATILQVTEIQKQCCDFITQRLDPSNCLGVREFADTYSCIELYKAAHEYAIELFEDVVKSDEFLRLPVNQLIEFISNDELNLPSEEVAFEAVMRWIRADRNERLVHLPEVMQHVRLSQLTPQYLVKTVSQDVLIRSNEKCREYVDEAKDYLLLPQERAERQGQHARFRPRKLYRLLLVEKLYSVGGWVQGDAIDSAEKYDPDTNQWTVLKKMSSRRCGVAVAALNDKLYAVGGHDGTSYLDTIEIYDPVANEWFADVVKLPSCRTSVGVVALNNCLYVIGGQEGQVGLNTVDRYNPTERTWHKCKPMNTKRLGSGVAALNGYIYAVGGTEKHVPTETVERYDPETDRWEFVASMSTKRKHLGCVAFDKMIYAVGGRDERFELSSAERYDPRLDRWEPITPMSERRSGVGLAEVKGKIYAVGGFDGDNYKRSVEVYDPATTHWRPCEAMTYERLGGGVAVLMEKRILRSYVPKTDTWPTSGHNGRDHGRGSNGRGGGGGGNSNNGNDNINTRPSQPSRKSATDFMNINMNGSSSGVNQSNTPQLNGLMRRKRSNSNTSNKVGNEFRYL
ncbi:Kelch-like protein 20, partial [Fragariocoptes setiger]